MGRVGAGRNLDAEQSREAYCQMLTRLGIAAQRWSTTTPWTNVYGVARSLLALAPAGTLAFSAPGTLFRPAAGLPPAPYCLGPGRISIFCLVPQDRLWLARWLGAAILLVVASGWRPRFTALFHWWIAFSLFVSATIPDGGDQATSVLTLLMLPVALTDPRRWHWQALHEQTPTATRHVLRLLALSALLVIRVQVAGIYLNSSIAKLAVTEWRDGTAVYYWISQPVFGAPGWLHGILLAVAATSLGVIAMTWGTLILEFTLGIAFAGLAGVLVPKPPPLLFYLMLVAMIYNLAVMVANGQVSDARAPRLALVTTVFDQFFDVAFIAIYATTGLAGGNQVAAYFPGLVEAVAYFGVAGAVLSVGIFFIGITLLDTASWYIGHAHISPSWLIGVTLIITLAAVTLVTVNRILTAPVDATELAPGLRLSRREQDVLRLVAEGYSNTMIAARLNLSDNTVKSYVESLLTHLNARNRAEAVAAASRLKLI